MKRRKATSARTWGPDESHLIGEGDCSVTYGHFTGEDDFRILKEEVHWQSMFHASGEVPRLVCCQGQVDASDGSKPVYRHPADQTLPLEPFTARVHLIRRRVEELVGHPLNHALIQLYRSGDDHITEHSDKTLDIVRGSKIANVSLGAQRVMRLRTKKSHPSQSSSMGADPSRTTQSVALPHGSVFVLGPRSNARWLHGIRQDRRPPSERTEAELAFGGARISLTFRHVGTFLDACDAFIWGQGAVAKDKNAARPVVNGDEEETRRLIDAFGAENQSSDFDWDAVYGAGSDVLHFRSSTTE